MLTHSARTHAPPPMTENAMMVGPAHSIPSVPMEPTAMTAVYGLLPLLHHQDVVPTPAPPPMTESAMTVDLAPCTPSVPTEPTVVTVVYATE